MLLLHTNFCSGTTNISGTTFKMLTKPFDATSHFVYDTYHTGTYGTRGHTLPQGSALAGMVISVV